MGDLSNAAVLLDSGQLVLIAVLGGITGVPELRQNR